MSDTTLPEDFENTDEEVAFMKDTDWGHRLWPRADRYVDDDGEWSLGIKGDEAIFNEVHNLLMANGFLVEDETEAYIKKTDLSEECKQE